MAAFYVMILNNDNNNNNNSNVERDLGGHNNIK